MPLGITNKNTNFCWDWLRNDVTMTSSLILRTWFFKSTLQRMCCHGNIKHCILLKFCTKVLTIISKYTSKFSENWLKNSVTVKSLLSWMGWFQISADSKMCCHGNINSLILLKFGTKIQLSISNKIQNFCQDWLRNDVTLTSLLFWRTQSFQSAPLRKCCHDNSKDLHSNFYLLSNSHIFSGKVTKFGWIIFLPLWVMGKNLKGGAKHPPPSGQDGILWR